MGRKNMTGDALQSSLHQGIVTALRTKVPTSISALTTNSNSTNSTPSHIPILNPWPMPKQSYVYDLRTHSGLLEKHAWTSWDRFVAHRAFKALRKGVGIPEAGSGHPKRTRL